MLTWIYVLVILAAVCFVWGAVVRFVRKQEGTLWWRGAIGLLAFAMTLAMLEILKVLSGPR